MVNYQWVTTTVNDQKHQQFVAPAKAGAQII